MIDNLSLLLSHGLMLYVAYRLMTRADLDHESDGPLPPSSPPPSSTRRVKRR